MGLKDMLQNKELKNIIKPILPTKYSFSTNLKWNIEAFSKDYTLLIPNELGSKGDSILIGIAFDYMARFIIANYIENNKESVLQNLVCEKFLELIEGIMNEEVLIKNKILYNDKISRIKNYIFNCNIDDYDSIMLDVLTLARFECIYRTGIENMISIIKDARTRDQALIIDLKKNCELFKKVFIDSGLVKTWSSVVFNPTFGIWSHKCFGADADIFIDGVLYDFKCVSRNSYKIDDIAQICGYYLLHRLTQVKDNTDERDDVKTVPAPLKDMTINSIALYKSRFGAIERYDVNKFDNDTFNEVLEQVRTFINKYYDINSSININSLWQQYLKNNITPN